MIALCNQIIGGVVVGSHAMVVAGYTNAGSTEIVIDPWDGYSHQVSYTGLTSSGSYNNYYWVKSIGT